MSGQKPSPAEMRRLSSFIGTMLKRKIGDNPDMDKIRAGVEAVIKEIGVLGIDQIKLVDVKVGEDPNVMIATIELPGWYYEHIFRPKEQP